jgi:hypothetical protein
MLKVDFNPPDGFRVIPNFPDYSISKNGAVLSVRGKHGPRPWSKAKPVSPLNKRGYLCVKIKNDNGLRQAYIHSLVLETYVGPKPNSHQCRHLDGCRSNNNLDNLCWGTAVENQSDKVLHDTGCRGETHGRSVLKEADIIEIRNQHEAGEKPVNIAKKFSVSMTRIWSIVNRHSWKHV